MRAFVLTRLAAFAGAVLGAALMLFLVLDLLPGAAGSDRSGLERFLGLFAGSGDAWPRLGVTLPLALLALALAALLGLGLATLTTLYRRSQIGRAAEALAAILSAIPPFWLGLLLALLVAGALKLLPASGFVPWANPIGALASLILPALALGLPYAGQFARRLTAGLPEPKPAELRRLRLDGLSQQQAQRRLLRAQWLPELPQVLAHTFGALLFAAALVESVFYLPGLGRLVLGAAEQHDLVLLRGGLFVLVLVTCLGMLGFTLLRLVADPGLER